MRMGPIYIIRLEKIPPFQLFWSYLCKTSKFSVESTDHSIHFILAFFANKWLSYMNDLQLKTTQLFFNFIEPNGVHTATNCLRWLQVRQWKATGYNFRIIFGLFKQFPLQIFHLKEVKGDEFFSKNPNKSINENVPSARHRK